MRLFLEGSSKAAVAETEVDEEDGIFGTDPLDLRLDVAFARFALGFDEAVSAVSAPPSVRPIAVNASRLGGSATSFEMVSAALGTKMSIGSWI